jgi:hypothetical protein
MLQFRLQWQNKRNTKFGFCRKKENDIWLVSWRQSPFRLRNHVKYINITYSMYHIRKLTTDIYFLQTITNIADDEWDDEGVQRRLFERKNTDVAHSKVGNFNGGVTWTKTYHLHIVTRPNATKPNRPGPKVIQHTDALSRLSWVFDSTLYCILQIITTIYTYTDMMYSKWKINVIYQFYNVY